MIRGRMESRVRPRPSRGVAIRCLSLVPRGELSTGPELLQSLEDVQLTGVASDVGVVAMSDRGAGATEAVVPFAPKPNAQARSWRST